MKFLFDTHGILILLHLYFNEGKLFLQESANKLSNSTPQEKVEVGSWWLQSVGRSPRSSDCSLVPVEILDSIPGVSGSGLRTIREGVIIGHFHPDKHDRIQKKYWETDVSDLVWVVTKYELQTLPNAKVMAIHI